MPVVPISPALVSGAVNYNSPLVAIPTRLCSKPGEVIKPSQTGEVPSFVPMQFAFTTNAVWLVDLSRITPTRPFSQVCAMYVDNTASDHDINILFPDSGFQARVAFGDTAMIPVLTSSIQPKFYVILDNDNNVSPTDTCNIFAINHYVPPSETSTFARTVSYGYGQFFNLQPTFTQSTSFTALATYPQLGALTPTLFPLIPNMQWFVTGIDISAAIVSADTSGFANFVLYDAGVPFYQHILTVIQSPQSEIFDVTIPGLNYISSGLGPLSAAFFSGNTLNQYEVAMNIFGGVLVA